MNITIIGLGYVGLPLAVEFAKYFPVTGYDIKRNRVIELNKGIDSTFEVETKNLKKVLTDKNKSVGLFLTNDSKLINDSNIYIITVPTPIDSNNNPDLTPLEKASKLVGEIVKIGDIIVIKAGERVPLDSLVIEGQSTLDTSALTGESLPTNVEFDSEILNVSVI